MYEILPYSFKKAVELGVQLKPSQRKNKKIDVFKHGKYVVSIGQLGAMDYPHYIKDYGIDYANERRKLYYKRHDNDKGIAGELSKKILW